MKSWVRFAIAITVGAGAGLAVALAQLGGGGMGRQATNGPWSTNRDQGTAAASALTRARVARFGLLALPPKEAMYYTASTDSAGDPLRGDCFYRVSGGELAARWWSVTLYEGEGWLVKNPANRWSVAGSALPRDARGGWFFTVGPDGTGGAWLPTGRAPTFELTLRVYHPQGALLDDPARAALPTISKERCA